MGDNDQNLEQALDEKQAYWEKLQRDDAEKRRLSTLSAMGWRPEFEDWTFEKYDVDFKNAAAFEACVKFSQKPFNMFLYGTPGNGKSRLAWAAGYKYKQQSAAAGKPVDMVFLPIADFNTKSIEAKKTNSKEFLRWLMRKDILILDDLGSEELSKSGTDTLTEFLNQWLWSKKKGLIIPCNYSIKDLALLLNNDRIPSRISGIMDLFIENLSDDHRTKELRTKTILSGRDFKETLKNVGAAQ